MTTFTIKKRITEKNTRETGRNWANSIKEKMKSREKYTERDRGYTKSHVLRKGMCLERSECSTGNSLSKFQDWSAKADGDPEEVPDEGALEKKVDIHYLQR